MAIPLAPVYVFGEAMIELSNVQMDQARLGVAGDTFNTALYLARSGIPVRYVTALGDDPFSGRILGALQTEQINTQSVLIRPDAAPGLYAIDLDANGERSFTYWRGQSAARHFFATSGADVVCAEMKQAQTLYLSGITMSIFDTKSRAKIIDILRAVNQSGGDVVFDTNYRAKGWKNKDHAKAAIAELMPYITIALPTWEDERDLYGDVDAKICADRWHKAGAREVVVKAGAQGAYSKDTSWIAPPINIDPIDTTGAGDSFNGAYLAARLSGAGIKQAILAGHKLAAKVLMTTGAILKEVD